MEVLRLVANGVWGAEEYDAVYKAPNTFKVCLFSCIGASGEIREDECNLSSIQDT
jgi:hypothetical protein